MTGYIPKGGNFRRYERLQSWGAEYGGLVDGKEITVTGPELFESALEWLRTHYQEKPFFLERDVVWTIQTQLIKTIKEQGLEYRVFNDYKLLPARKSSIQADIAIVDADEHILVAAELKYEPDHSRSGQDFRASKFSPSVFGWRDVLADLERLQRFVSEPELAQLAYLVAIDEGNYHRNRNPDAPEGTEWIPWGTSISILFARVNRPPVPSVSQ